MEVDTDFDQYEDHETDTSYDQYENHEIDWNQQENHETDTNYDQHENQETDWTQYENNVVYVDAPSEYNETQLAIDPSTFVYADIADSGWFLVFLPNHAWIKLACYFSRIL